MATEVMQRAEARIGQVLRERYRIDAILGVGGMAVVYLATHRNKKRFAVKMLLPELASNAETRERFVREGYVANTVDHPGAVSVIDDDVTPDGAPFIVMELLDGEEVGVLAEKRGGLPIPTVLALADEVLGVLEAAHAKGVVHRDLKPANLFITRDGGVKVLDFGIARMREGGLAASASLTRTGALMGTPAFLPPEQAGGRTRDVDHQTDLWALGATMFTLLTGHYVHDAENATQIIILAATQPARSLATVLPNAPATLVQLVDRALAFDKAVRWPNAAAMRAATREARRATSGAASTRDTLAEMFGIGNWETKAQVLQPPPGVTSLPPLASASQPDHSTAPMPVGSRPVYPTAPMAGSQPSIANVATASPMERSLGTVPHQHTSRTWLALILGVLGVLAVGAGASFAIVSRSSSQRGSTTAVAAPSIVPPQTSTAAASSVAIAPEAPPPASTSVTSARPAAPSAKPSAVAPAHDQHAASSGCVDGVITIRQPNGQPTFIPCK
jgi:eukaryotic-like serine/threonine-protein kinase